jgi:hypothetical protein
LAKETLAHASSTLNGTGISCSSSAAFLAENLSTRFGGVMVANLLIDDEIAGATVGRLGPSDNTAAAKVGDEEERATVLRRAFSTDVVITKKKEK